jgi:hypothetical protein
MASVCMAASRRAVAEGARVAGRAARRLHASPAGAGSSGWRSRVGESVSLDAIVPWSLLAAGMTALGLASTRDTAEAEVCYSPGNRDRRLPSADRSGAGPSCAHILLCMISMPTAPAPCACHHAPTGSLARR